jgi:hypothetical protein
MTQHELLLRLLLLARDVEENGLLFRTRGRHQARFYERNPSARKWIVHGMLTYYREADLAEMQTVLESDTQLMEFYDRNRIELEMARLTLAYPTCWYAWVNCVTWRLPSVRWPLTLRSST